MRTPCKEIKISESLTSQTCAKHFLHPGVDRSHGYYQFTNEATEIRRIAHPEKEVVACVQTPGVRLQLVLLDWLGS